MKIMVRKISYKQWNKLLLDEETTYIANEHDICYRIGSLYACCITNGEVNNIIIWSPKYDIRNIKSALQFIEILYLQYNIVYIRIEGRKNRYHFFKKLFGMNMLLLSMENRDVYYCKIDSDIIEKIDEILKI